ncbi:epididymal-specific lipocalin-12 isoform X3 [Eulemur rufifrons]|uniref:epididymal-specific lipocalin-12 isoform X3 n=1 Tax=Eulemur rufifrons TaxID=859984 RepID=UPI0037446C0B
MGPWCAPWLLLTLPDVLWGQTQSSQPAQPGMQSFQGDQVRGLPGREAAGWGRSLGGEEAVQAGVAAQGVQQVSSGCQGPRPCLQGPGTSAQARTERDPGRTFLGLPFPPAPLAHAAAEAQGGQTSAPGPGPAPLPREGSWLRPCRAGGRGSRPHQQPLQFQGEWFVLGLASNTFGKEHKALLVPFTTTFELTAQGHFTVSNAMTRTRVRQRGDPGGGQRLHQLRPAALAQARGQPDGGQSQPAGQELDAAARDHRQVHLPGPDPGLLEEQRRLPRPGRVAARGGHLLTGRAALPRPLAPQPGAPLAGE